MNGMAVNDEDRKVRDKCLYLKQLLQDKKQIQGLNGFFLHADRILDEGEEFFFFNFMSQMHCIIKTINVRFFQLEHSPHFSKNLFYRRQLVRNLLQIHTTHTHDFAPSIVPVFCQLII